MTDRDHFAAAALAGLLAQGDDGSFSEESYAVAAYRWADAMLRVRDSRTADKPNLDAAPAARATTKPGGLNSGSASGTSGEQSPVTTRDCGTGDTPATEKEKLAEVSDRTDPVPYAKTYENLGFAPTKRDTTPPRNGTPQDGSLQGEGSVPDSRIANEPVAWALICGDCVDSTFTDRDEAVEWASGIIPPAQIVPLYRHPPATLTDAERLGAANSGDDRRSVGGE